ncbi:hypothetical protein ACFW2Y_28515 [Streptomyces sp. NPDC058877]|uniref:hypothetical protein n=1 Tax=Streptomyces sp. NPDC058877 TaxID=3346665 RepID=UPI0036CCAB26
MSGSVCWYPEGSNPGGMEVSGYLYDAEGDSPSVKVQGKVSGYGYGTPWTGSKGNEARVRGDEVVYAPAALYANDGSMQTCRYNGWGTDKCTSAYMTR